MARTIIKTALAMVAVSGPVRCPAQTNYCSESSKLFSQPAIQLRQEPKEEEKARILEPEKPSLNLSATLDSTVPTHNLQLAASLGDQDLHSRVINSHVFYLTRDELHFDNKVNQFIDQVYRPEVFHVGKVPMSLSIVTAIKRKNPLCLLNPIVFQVSW